MRKYLTHRHRLFGKPWGEGEHGAKSLSTNGVYPTHVHTTLADILTDLSEALLAKRASLGLSIAIANMRVDRNSEMFGEIIRVDHLISYRRYLKQSMNNFVNRFNQRLVVEDDQFNHWMINPEEKLLSVDELEWAEIPDEISELKQYLKPFLPKAGKFAHWIGYAKSNLKSGDLHQHAMLEFKTRQGNTGSGDPGINDYKYCEKILYAYKFFAHAAARANQKIGLSTNAANEFLLQAEAFNSTLWNSKILSYLQETDPNINLDEFTSEKGLDETTERHKLFIKHLGIKNDDNSHSLIENGASDAYKFHIGMTSYGAIKDAIERIRFTERPSVSRMASNHGNPAHMGKLFGKQFTANEEIRTDYDISQAWRDDPRVITLSCSLILALLSNTSGLLCNGLAVLVYKDILLKHANETFNIVSFADKNLRIRELVHAIVNKIKPDEAFQNNLRRQLNYAVTRGLYITIERYRYPILNRLNGLKVLADNAVLSSSILKMGDHEYSYGETPYKKGTEAKEKTEQRLKDMRIKNISHIGRLVRELAATTDIYGSEMHFPSYRIGTTMALVFLLRGRIR